METLSAFWAYTLNCSCTKCTGHQDVTVAKWLPHLPSDITVEGLLGSLDCAECGATGSFDVQARLASALHGGRADVQPHEEPLVANMRA